MLDQSFEALAADTKNIVNWTQLKVETTANTLQIEIEENKIERQRFMAERLLAYVAFELYARERDELKTWQTAKIFFDQNPDNT